MATTSKPKSKAKSNGAPARSAVRRYQMFIGGKFADAASGKTFDVFDPATEAVIATCPAGAAGGCRPGGEGGEARLL